MEIVLDYEKIFRTVASIKVQRAELTCDVIK